MERFDAKTLDLSNEDSLFKAVTWVKPSSSELRRQPSTSTECGSLEKKHPDPEDDTGGSWDILAEFMRLTYEVDGQTFAKTIDRYVDVENMIDYWLFVNLIVGVDNSYKNTFYATVDGKMYAYPWDLDITFGLRWGEDSPNYLGHDPTLATQTFDFACGRRLIKYYPGGAQYAKQRWDDLKASGVINADSIMQTAQQYFDLLHASGAWARNKARWPDGNYAEDLSYFEDILREHIDYLDRKSLNYFRTAV